MLRLQYIEYGLIPGKGGLELDLNTDAAAIAWNQPGLIGPWSFFRVYGRGQGVYGNMLADYARSGVQVPGRTIGAAYLLGGGMVRLTPVHEETLMVSFDSILEARQWFHYRLPETNPNLVLPANNASFDGTLAVETVKGKNETPLQRLHGFFLRGEATAFLQPGIEDWGSIGSEDDGRNAGLDYWAARGRAQITASAVGPELKVFRPLILAHVDLGYGRGLDDRNRFMVGGVSPYVVQLAGAGWSEFLVDRYLAGHLQVGTMWFEKLAVEAGVDLAMVNDPAREGKLDDLGLMRGYFLKVELLLAKHLVLHTVMSLASGNHRKNQDVNPALWTYLQWKMYPF